MECFSRFSILELKKGSNRQAPAEQRKPVNLQQEKVGEKKVVVKKKRHR